jgi:hypothetical protein
MNEHKSQLMEGFESRQHINSTEKMSSSRWDTPLKMARLLAEDMAKRVTESRNSFPCLFFRGDCHSHTVHSDGCGTVAETAAMVEAAELDFQFVTDHWGVTQAPECYEHGLWVGQEPGTEHHHMGILGLDYAFTPRRQFLADFAEAASLGATVFLPHPTGWWPARVYSDEQKKIVDKLPTPFLMEICNGANNIVSAFDYTDESAIELWDHLLMQGKVVYAMGNTDAHAPHSIGIVWNSVFAETCDQQSILTELSAGHSFVSDAPLVHIALGSARMGDHASAADRNSTLKITAVDSRGLASVRVIADGQTVFTQLLDRVDKWEHSYALPATIQRYMRIEVRSIDGRRAYTNPIYL